eukprot:Rhum_TRINITY_DN259_c0_g1::Rhum_TRINITY_DN259_c0_g1_i1::g.1021::m.1021
MTHNSGTHSESHAACLHRLRHVNPPVLLHQGTHRGVVVVLLHQQSVHVPDVVQRDAVSVDLARQRGRRRTREEAVHAGNVVGVVVWAVSRRTRSDQLRHQLLLIVSEALQSLLHVFLFALDRLRERQLLLLRCDQPLQLPHIRTDLEVVLLQQVVDFLTLPSGVLHARLQRLKSILWRGALLCDLQLLPRVFPFRDPLQSHVLELREVHRQHVQGSADASVARRQLVSDHRDGGLDDDWARGLIVRVRPCEVQHLPCDDGGLLLTDWLPAALQVDDDHKGLLVLLAADGVDRFHTVPAGLVGGALLQELEAAREHLLEADVVNALWVEGDFKEAYTLPLGERTPDNARLPGGLRPQHHIERTLLLLVEGQRVILQHLSLFFDDGPHVLWLLTFETPGEHRLALLL